MIKTPLFDVPSYADLSTALSSTAAAHTDAPAVTWYDRAGMEHTKTFGELLTDSAVFASALLRDGLRGEKVAIACENCYEWLFMFFGITASGGTAVLVDVEQPEASICSMITRTGAKLAAVSPSIAALVRDKLEGQGVAVLVVSAVDSDGLRSLYSFIARDEAQDEAEAASFRAFAPDPDSVAAIAFTSGTSSLPKPVMLTHRGITGNALASVAMVKPSARVFTSLPLYHTYGLTCGALCILFYGSELGICCDIKRITRDFLVFDAEILMAVPLVVEMIYRRIVHCMESAGYKRLMDNELNNFRLGLAFMHRKPRKLLVEAKNKGIGKLSLIVCGGAHLARSVADNMEAFGVLVLEGYGITECSPLVSVNRVREHLPHSAGLVLPGYKVRIEDGEILVCGDMLMKGYYGDPAATAAAMDDGWFRTGDMGYTDARGFLHITGRRKTLIVLKNGKKIAPEEIEGYLAGAPLVGEVVARGVQSGESADDVRLAVTVYPDPAATEGMSQYEIIERLQRYVDGVNSHLPAYKQIQMVNLSSKEFEKTANRKLKR